MTITNKNQFNRISSIIQPKILYLSMIALFGVQVIDNTASAAFFDQSNTGREESLLQDTTETGTIKSMQDIDTIKNLFQFNNTPNLEAIRLTNQGLEKLKSGDKTQGLKDLQEAWKISPKTLISGVMLGLNHIENKDYNQALQIAKEIQKLITIDNYGLGYTIEGMAYAGKGELDKATSAFKEAIRLIPNETNSLLNLAILAEEQKSYSDAKKYLQKIIYTNPTHLIALEKLAKIEITLGNTEIANDLLKKAIKAYPEEIRPVILLAQNYLNLGQFQQVITLTQNKTNPAIMEMLGKAYLNLGEAEKAKQVFEKIIEQLPKSAPANYILAELYAKTGNLPEATKQIQITLNKDPKFLPARIGEVKTLFYNGKVSEAEKASQLLIKEFGNQQEVLSINGWISMHQNNYAQAEKYFEAMSKSNLNSEIVLWWVNSLWAQKKHDPGFAIINEWLQNHPDDARVQQALAEGYMGQQKTPQAKAAYLKLVKLQPKSASAYNNLAWLEKDEDLKKAIHYAETALSLEKENPQILDTLGMLLVNDGQIDKGAALLKQAVDKAPDDIELLYHWAEILILQNKNAEANLILDKLAKHEPNPVMQERIKTLRIKTANK